MNMNGKKILIKQAELDSLVQLREKFAKSRCKIDIYERFAFVNNNGIVETIRFNDNLI